MKGRHNNSPSGRERFNDLMRNIERDTFPRPCPALMNNVPAMPATQIVLREHVETPSREVSETVTIPRSEYDRFKAAETLINLMLKGFRSEKMDKFTCGGLIESISLIYAGDDLNPEVNAKADSASTDSPSAD